MSDWFPKIDTRSSDTARADARHLEILRELLDRDYLAKADWDYTLIDLSQMVQTVLGADHAIVALWDRELGQWSAITSGGQELSHHAISQHGSRSTLEHVRTTERPILTQNDQAMVLGSESIRRHRVESVVAVPFYFWEAHTSQPATKRLGGCLYAHRTDTQPSFSPRDIEVIQDIARIAQPTLGVLRNLHQVRRDLETSQLQVKELQRSRAHEASLGQFTTRDRWFARHVIEPLNRVSHAHKVSILLLGPTGAGKTWLAEAYHHQCPRHDAPFITLDCAQVTSVETLSAELFGYAPNSGYANAPKRGRPGKALLADQGTLFIDEIGTLPAELQQRLLRLLERGTFSPLGSSEQSQVDLQIIAATNEDLQSLVRQGRFREDLFWRISDVTVQLPPLSDRVSDIPALAEVFLTRALDRSGRHTITGFSDAAMSQLMAHPWARAGNIRGLERSILRSVLLA
ncbi:MAG: sigma 54-interacting transcriptional regulator, partial [Myxococcota bacterium]